MGSGPKSEESGRKAPGSLVLLTVPLCSEELRLTLNLLLPPLSAGVTDVSQCAWFCGLAHKASTPSQLRTSPAL